MMQIRNQPLLRAIASSATAPNNYPVQSQQAHRNQVVEKQATIARTLALLEKYYQQAKRDR